MSDPAVVIRTPDITLLDLRQNCLPSPSLRDQKGHIGELTSANVIEVQDKWVSLAAVDTWMVR